MQIVLGSTNQSLDLQVVDDTGLPVTALDASTFPSLFYALRGPHADVSIGALNDLANLTDAYNALGIKERAGGFYRFDAPDAMFATAGDLRIWGETTGKHVLHPVIEVQGSYGTGSGAYTVALTVNDGTNPLSGASVRLTKGSLTYLGQTNTNGQITFNVDSGDWTVAITSAGYTFNGTALTVSADVTQTYSMTQTVITIVSPGFTTGYLTCYDSQGIIAQGIVIIAQFVQADVSDTGHSYSSATLSETSDASGLVEFSNLVIGATYRFYRGSTSSAPYIQTIPLNAGSTFALNPAIGTP